MNGRNYNQNEMNQDYISDCCPSCEYIPPQNNTAQPQQNTSRSSSRNGRNGRTIIRDPVTNREISVSRNDTNNYEEAMGCSCINPSACLCLLTAALLILIGSLSSHAGLFTSLFSSSSSLLSSSSLTGQLAHERVFKGQFLVTRGEPYDPRFEFPDSNHFKETAKKWTDRLDFLFSGSTSSSTHARSSPSLLTKLFKRSEILALERGPRGAGSDDTLIHFNLHFKRIKQGQSGLRSESDQSSEDPLNSASVYVIIATELLRMKSAPSNSRGGSSSSNGNNQATFDPVFGKGVTIDQASLDIEERRPPSDVLPVLVNGGHVTNPNWIKAGSTFPFFSGRSPSAHASESGLTNGRTSAGIAQPSWLEPRTRFPGLLEGLNEQATGPGPRTCAKIQLALCQPSAHASKSEDSYGNDGYVNGQFSRSIIVPNDVTYNVTSWPNLIGHWNLSSLLDTVLSFRSLIDAECHPRAKEFICRLLQPECLSRSETEAKGNVGEERNLAEEIEDIPVYPCRDFCTDFWSGCGQFITEFITDPKVRDRMKCSNFPRFDKDPDDDHYHYLDEPADQHLVHAFDGRKKYDSKKKVDKVTRKRREGRRCKSR